MVGQFKEAHLRPRHPPSLMTPRRITSINNSSYPDHSDFSVTVVLAANGSRATPVTRLREPTQVCLGPLASALSVERSSHLRVATVHRRIFAATQA